MLIRTAFAIAFVVAAPAIAQTLDIAVPERVLRVGPDEAFKRPSAAAAAAQSGDRIVIAPGIYRDCAVWKAARLTIEAGPGGPVEITGSTCGDKGLFVIAAPDAMVDGITFRGATASGGNGAGIRAEGGTLTVRRSSFIDNENGILTHALLTQATLRIEDSRFLRNGALRDGLECAHGIYAGMLALVSIERSRFAGTQICHHVKSRAARTEIIDSTIEDGPEGNSSYLVDTPNGGDLLIRGSTLRKGPRTNNPRAAIMIAAEGVRHPTNSLRIENNLFENLMSRRTTFVENRSTAPTDLAGNVLRGSITPLTGPGTLR